jgi:hypothetical protein
MPAARRAQYLKNRKPRLCQCGAEIALGSRNRSCDPCRETPNPVCKKCCKSLPISSFSKDSSRLSGIFPWCKTCQKDSTQKFQNPDDELNGHICPLCDTPTRGHRNRRYCSKTCMYRSRSIRRYGLTVPEYRRLLDATNGKCPICDKVPNRWNIDHDHNTGLVTGLVCTGCNIGPLAHSLHSVEFVKKLLSFLENPPAKTLGIVAVSEPALPSNLHMLWGYAAS